MGVIKRAGKWILMTVFALILASATSVKADDPIGGTTGTSGNVEYMDKLQTGTGKSIKDNPQFNSVATVIQNAAKFVIIAAMVCFFFSILVSGYRIVFMGDKKGALDKARHNLTLGIIGLLVVAFAYAVAKMLENAVGVTKWMN